MLLPRAALLLLHLLGAQVSAAPLNISFLGRYALDGPGATVQLHHPALLAAKFTILGCSIDRHDPNVGWPGYSRPNGTKHTSDAVFMPATRAPTPGVALCDLGKAEFPLITSGNATLSVLTSDCPPEPCTHVPTPKCCSAISGYVELFALFDPQFGRRPYFHEAEGSIVVATDPSPLSWHGAATLRITATLPGGVAVSAEVPAGGRYRIPVDMAKVPPKASEVVTITLSGPAGLRISKQRRFVRHPPPPQTSAITAFQVDHEVGGGLRANGAQFLAQGWFNGGYSHTVDGLGAKAFAQILGVGEPNWYERQALNLGAIASHWGARGLNFVRFQSQVFPEWGLNHAKEQLAAFTTYLDICASAGVYVRSHMPLKRTVWRVRCSSTPALLM